jgi:hypothetical protein
MLGNLVAFLLYLSRRRQGRRLLSAANFRRQDRLQHINIARRKRSEPQRGTPTSSSLMRATMPVIPCMRSNVTLSTQ